MVNIKKCRYCGNPINVDTDTDWIMPSRGWYYHKNCYAEKEIAAAAKNSIKKCQACGGEINKDKDDDWCMPSKGKYYHKRCYTTDEEYKTKIY